MGKRKIKFRGKDENTGEWRYGDLIGKFSILEDYDTIKNLNDDSHYNYLLKAKKFNVDLNTVGEFTGKIDAQGKEIYEGDIVFWKDGSREKKHWRYAEVFYRIETMCWHFKIVTCGTLSAGYVFENNFGGHNEIVVVGNKYDERWQKI